MAGPSRVHAMLGAATFPLVAVLLSSCGTDTGGDSGSTSTTLTTTTRSVAPSHYRHGAALGGWFVMETHWMYDQFSAPSENDWVGYLRSNPPSIAPYYCTAANSSVCGDYYAIQTMRNHWAGYYTPGMMEELVRKGVEDVRVAVGYWMFDAPVEAAPRFGMEHGAPPGLIMNWEGCRCEPSKNGTICEWQPFIVTTSCADVPRPPTMYDFGFNAEGFVTGGLNYLEQMLPVLKSYSVHVMLDLHAAPSGATHLNSYPGVWVQDISEIWDGGDARFGGAEQPARYAAVGSAICGVQAGQPIDNRTWDGDGLCAHPDGATSHCSCGPGVRGAGEPILPGHVAIKGSRFYLSTRSGSACLVDSSTGAKWGAESAGHKAPSSYARAKLPADGVCHSWQDVAVVALVTMAQWAFDLQSLQLPGPTRFCHLRSCADVIFALESINEPALNEERTYREHIKKFEQRVVGTIHEIFVGPEGVPEMETTLQFTGDAANFSDFMAKQKDPSWWVPWVSLDFHRYYTWDPELVNWTQAAKKVDTASGGWLPYVYAGIRTYIAEWSLAINLDQVSLSNASMNNQFVSEGVDNRPAMLRFFTQQKCNWRHAGGSGDFYWTARMGSGWEPRRERCHAVGLEAPCQVAEDGLVSSYSSSLPRFRFPVWSFLAVLRELPISHLDALECQSGTGSERRGVGQVVV